MAARKGTRAHRKKNSGARRSRKPQTKPRAPQQTALRVVDQRPFLKKAATECRRLRTELEKKRHRLTVFEESEKPAYDRWLHATFGRELTAIRELRDEVGAMQFILYHLEMCDRFVPEKLGEVYEELFRRKAEGTLAAFEPPRPEGAEDGEDEEDAPEDEDAESETPDDWEQELRDAFEKAFREFFGAGAGDGGPDADDFAGRRATDAAKNGAGEADPGLKALYRTLAKRLHPDHSQLDETVREHRWHELQEAYENRDRPRMQRIETVCDMEDTGISLSLGLARLRELAAYLRDHIGPVRDGLKEAKRHPAFGFTPEDSAETRERIAEELEDERAYFADEVSQMKTCAQQFKAEFDADFRDAPEDDQAEPDDDWDPFDNPFPDPRGSGVRV